MPDGLCRYNNLGSGMLPCAEGSGRCAKALTNLAVQGAKYTQDSYRFAANAFHQQWLSAHPEIKAAVHIAQQVRY